VDQKRRTYLLLAVIYLGYMSLGLPDGTFGVVWPKIYPELNLPVGLAGVITTVGTMLTATAGFSSGWIIARWRTGPVVLVSGLLTATGLLMLAQANNAVWLFAAVVPLGLGAGAVDAGLNGYVARHYSGRHMNWLHACWGLGAMSGPLVMASALASSRGWRGGYFVLGLAQLGLAVVFLLTLRLWSRVPERAVEKANRPVPIRPPTHLANSFAGWLSAIIFALYVAVELTTGLWASSILVVARGVAPESAAICVMAFYGAITGGRILVGFVVGLLGARALVTGGACTALLGAFIFNYSGTTIMAATALILIGLGFAPVYPCLMHEVPRRFAPEAVQTVIGRQSGAASLGAGFLPAVAGWLAQKSLDGIPWLIVGGVIALIGCIRLLDRVTPSH